MTSWESLPCPKLHAQLLSLEIRSSQVSRAELTVSIRSVTEHGMSSSSGLPGHHRRCGVRGVDDKMLPGQVAPAQHHGPPDPRLWNTREPPLESSADRHSTQGPSWLQLAAVPQKS